MRRLRTSAARAGRVPAWLRAGIAACLALVLAACDGPASVQSLGGESMGSTWSVRYVGADASSAAMRAAIVTRLDRVDRQMSTWKSDSDLSRFNNAAAGTWVDVPQELFDVVEAALALASDTQGAYDPTIGPLVDLWGFGPDGPRRQPPDDASIDALRARVGWQRVKLDRAQRRILQAGGMHLDLSSIAPGHAVDSIAAHLESQGIVDYLVEVGGELRSRGRKPDGSDWQVAIQRPLDNDSADGGVVPAHVVSLRDAALGASGDYRHFFKAGGRRYAHRIDPRTGYPVANGVASVTVLRAQCMNADSLATAFSILGVRDGLDYARERGIGVLFIVRDGDRFEERMSPAFADLLAQ
jgi:thiamine biosynthesis lipoprotein